MNASGSTSNAVTITLTGDEALVLSDALSGWQSSGDLDRLAGDDTAARLLLLDLTASLEPLVEVAFSDDYADHVRKARSGLLGE